MSKFNTLLNKIINEDYSQLQDFEQEPLFVSSKGKDGISYVKKLDDYWKEVLKSTHKVSNFYITSVDDYAPVGTVFCVGPNKSKIKKDLEDFHKHLTPIG